jgi:hypothetical protein
LAFKDAQVHIWLSLSDGQLLQAAPSKTFNVLNYGATGHKSDDARPAIREGDRWLCRQGEWNCLRSAGEYTSGNFACSNVRLYQTGAYFVRFERQ